MASSPIEILQEAADGVDRLIKFLRKSKSPQIRSKEDLQTIKATILAWFNNYRGNLNGVDGGLFNAVEAEYTILFEYLSRATSRDKYQDSFKRLKTALVSLQSSVLTNSFNSGFQGEALRVDFSSLVSDARMRSILENRWNEITKCLEVGASLSATIMMGGLLEALFLALINGIADKKQIFKAKAAPKDRKTGDTLPLNEWTLNSYIEVGAELGWITVPSKEISIVLRNYRNFIHPERELSTGITLTPGDAKMFWSIFIQLAQQIVSCRV